MQLPMNREETDRLNARSPDRPALRPNPKQPLSPSTELALLTACCVRYEALKGGMFALEPDGGSPDGRNRDGTGGVNRSAAAVLRVPPDIVRQLRLAAGAHRSFIAHILQEALKVSAELESAGILCAAVKGPVLSRRLYGPTVMRQYRDLDLLV